MDNPADAVRSLGDVLRGVVMFPSVSVSSSWLWGFAWIWEIFSSRDCHIFPIKAFTGNFSTPWAGKLPESLEVIRKQCGKKKYKIPEHKGLWKATPQLELFQQCLSVLLLTDTTSTLQERKGKHVQLWGCFVRPRETKGQS